MSAPLALLMVEDSERDASLVLRELTRAGLELDCERVDSAAGLERALARRRWDLVLADFNLPAFDAFAALELVRATDPDVPFIVVSGTIGEATAVEVMRAGAHDYVMKDDLVRLVPAIQRELRDAQVRRGRARTARRMATQNAVAALLATARPWRETLAEILPIVGANLGWDFAAFWERAPGEEALRARITWCGDPALRDLEAMTRDLALRPGEALAGLVLEGGEPVWVPDVQARRELLRAQLVQRAGLHGALAFPVRIEAELFGVIELFSRRVEDPDVELLETLRTLGSQLGQAIGRERAIDALRESEALNAAVVASSLDAIVMMDGRGRVLEFNPAAERIFGRSRAAALGEDMAELIIPPALREQHRRGLARYLATGLGPLLGTRVELPGLRADGSEFAAELAVVSLRGRDSPLFAGFVRDISTRKAAEAGQQLLSDATATLGSSLEPEATLPAVARRCAAVARGWCVIDLLDGTATLRRVAAAHVDDAGQGLREELERLTPQALAATPSIARVLRLGETFSATDVSDRAPGVAGDAAHDDALERLRSRGLLAVPIRVGRSIRGLVTIASAPGLPLDTSLAEELARRIGMAIENARLFQDVQRGEARHRLLGGVSATLVESLDAGAALQRASELLVPDLADWCECVLLGAGAARPPTRAAFAHRDRGLGSVADELWREYPPALDDDVGVGRVLRTGEPVLVPHASEKMARSLARDARHAELLTRLGVGSFLIVPLTAHGAILGALTLALLPGPRSFAPDELAFAQEIARRCASAVENARLYEEAQASIRAREEFLVIAAHELQTPLTPLRLQIQNLLRQVDQGSVGQPERLRERLAILDRSTLRLMALIERLLDVSRAIVGREPLTLEEVDLVALAREVAGELAVELSRASCALTWRVPSEPVVGRWDPRRLAIVVRSLLSNAIKFGAGEPVELAITDAPEGVTLSVWDHGPGIPLEQQATLFARFARPAAVRHYGGFGLGLWIVQQLVDEHGGNVRLASRPGEGAKFTIWLPRTSSHAKMRA